MKRPLIWISMSWLMGILIGNLMYGVILLVLIVTLLIGQEQLKGMTYKHNILLLGLCLFSIGRVFVLNVHYEKAAESFHSSDEIRFSGKVDGLKKSGDYYSYDLKPFEVDGVSYTGKMKFISSEQVNYGDDIQGEGTILLSDGLRNEGGVDQKAYNKSKKIIVTVFGDIIDHKDSNDLSIKKILYAMRQKHEARLLTLLPTESGQVVGTLLLGSDLVEDELKDAFRTSGLIHILAISGLHVTLIGLGIFKILDKLVRIKSISAFLTLLFLITYCIYTGMHTSTIRATIMVILFLGQYMVTRRYDKTSALFFAALILCVFNPLTLFDMGFLLSFGAVASIFYIEPMLRVSFMEHENELSSSLRVMIAIQLGISPILAYAFYHLPLYGLIANLLVLPIVAFVILFAMSGLFLSYISMTLGSFIIGSTHWLINYMTHVTLLTSSLPLSYINAGKPPMIFLLLYYLLIILWVDGMKVKWCLLSSVVLMTAFMLSGVFAHNTLLIHMLDVGQGDASVIEYKGHTLMIDSGGDLKKKKDNVGRLILEPFFRSKGISKIDSVFISHSDFDHIYGLIELAQTTKINRVILPKAYEGQEDDLLEDLFEVLKLQNTQIIYFQPGDSINIEGLELTCLLPINNYNRDNNSNSMVILLNLDDFDMLFMGDTGAAEEAQLMTELKIKDGQIDVLKVGHHGSNTSSSESFVSAIQPHVSLISVGRKNTYGHPNEEVVNTLKEWSDSVKMTSEVGEITIAYKNESISIWSMVEE